jgi:hypothetical protein
MRTCYLQLNEYVSGCKGATSDISADDNTGGWSSWETIPANISTVTGTHNVYPEFVFSASGSPPFVSLHYFSFPA